jgi:hypothetical protein
VSLLIGYHQLEGRIVPLKKPLAVLEKEEEAGVAVGYKVKGSLFACHTLDVERVGRTLSSSVGSPATSAGNWCRASQARLPHQAKSSHFQSTHARPELRQLLGPGSASLDCQKGNASTRKTYHEQHWNG